MFMAATPYSVEFAWTQPRTAGRQYNITACVADQRVHLQKDVGHVGVQRHRSGFSVVVCTAHICTVSR